MVNILLQATVFESAKWANGPASTEILVSQLSK